MPWRQQRLYPGFQSTIHGSTQAQHDGSTATASTAGQPAQAMAGVSSQPAQQGATMPAASQPAHQGATVPAMVASGTASSVTQGATVPATVGSGAAPSATDSATSRVATGSTRAARTSHRYSRGEILSFRLHKDGQAHVAQGQCVASDGTKHIIAVRPGLYPGADAGGPPPPIPLLKLRTIK